MEVLFVEEDEELLEMDCDIADGFEVIGRSSNLDSKQQTEHSSDSTRHSSRNGGTPYSEEGFIAESDVCTQPEAREMIRRRSSVDIAMPLALLTAYLVILGCYIKS